MKTPDTGDVLFTRGRSLFNRLSVALTGPAAHQATFYDAGHVVEASKQTGRVVKRKLATVMADLERERSEWIVFHWIDPWISPYLRAKLQCDMLEATEFERYSSIELPLQALDVLWNKVILRRKAQGYDAKVFRKMGDIWNNGVICSKTSNRALINSGLIPEESGLEYGSPSDTYRYMLSLIRTESSGPAVVIVDHSAGWFK